MAFVTIMAREPVQETARETGTWWYSEPLVPEASRTLLLSYMVQKLFFLFKEGWDSFLLQPENFWLYRKKTSVYFEPTFFLLKSV